MERDKLINKMIKIALEKHQDVDFYKVATDLESYNYINLAGFESLKKVLIIGCANKNNILRICEKCSADSQIVIVDDNKEYLNSVKDSVVSLDKNIKLELNNLEKINVDGEKLKKLIEDNKVSSLEEYYNFTKKVNDLVLNSPLISNSSLDLVYIDLYNRYSKEHGINLLKQCFDLLRENGKVILNIVLSDEPMHKNIFNIHGGIEVKNIPVESEMFNLLEPLGYLGLKYTWRCEYPINILDTVELRKFTIEMFKGIQGICKEKGHAVLYSGPWKEVVDDDGHKLYRGQRSAVCEKTFNNLTSETYKGQVIGVKPYFEIAEEEAMVFDCSIRPIREAKITKGIKKLEVKDVEDINEIKCC